MKQLYHLPHGLHPQPKKEISIYTKQPKKYLLAIKSNKKAEGWFFRMACQEDGLSFDNPSRRFNCPSWINRLTSRSTRRSVIRSNLAISLFLYPSFRKRRTLCLRSGVTKD